MTLKFYKLILVALVLVGASCDATKNQVHDYQIVINGSATPTPVEFAGSYTCLSQTTELTRDISGSGSMAMSFQCHTLSLVRVQRILGSGMVSLAIYKNGEVIFESPPTDSSSPLIYVNQE